MLVCAPFAGDNKVAILQVRLIIHRIKDQVDSRFQRSLAQHEEGRSQTTRSPAAGNLLEVDPCLLADDIGQVFQAPVELRNHVRIGTLLRREDDRSAQGTIQGILDITGYPDLGIQQRWQDTRCVDLANGRQTTATRGHFAAVTQEFEPKGLCGTDSAIIRRTAAEAQDNLAAAAQNSIADEFAGPVSGGGKGIEKGARS